MRILQLCHKPPFPPVDGGCVAMNAITSGLLAKGHKVKILAVSTKKHPFNKEKVPAEYIKKTAIEAVFIDTGLKVSAGLKNLFSSGSYNVERFYSSAFEDKLKEVLRNEKFDVIHFESIFVAPYLKLAKALSDATVVLRAHNVEHRIWERMAAKTSNPLKKWYLGFLAKRLKEYELDILQQFDGIAAITEDDKKYFLDNGIKPAIEVFPLGIDSAQYKVAKPKEVEFPSLFHLGSMDWMPNEEGIKWFLEKVWIKVHTAYPELKLYLAGRNMPDWLANLDMEGVVIDGAVENARDYMSKKGVMIVPLLSGGGMRVKIIEGMALGKAIVSTTIGAEGINYTNGENMLIADTPEQMLEQIGKCLNDRNFFDRLGVNARKHAVANFDYKEVAGKLVGFYEKL